MPAGWRKVAGVLGVVTLARQGPAAPVDAPGDGAAAPARPLQAPGDAPGEGPAAPGDALGDGPAAPGDALGDGAAAPAIPPCPCCYYNLAQQVDGELAARTCGWFWMSSQQHWVWWHWDAPHVGGSAAAAPVSEFFGSNAFCVTTSF